MSRKKTNILFIVMALVAIVILIGTGAYAYYQTNIKGTTSGTIAKWDFKANNQTESFNLDFGSLYPGKSGTYNLELSAENSDLDVYYEFIIHKNTRLTNNIFFDNAYTVGPNESGDWKVGKYGVITAGSKLTIPLYYNWPYSNQNDNESWADGSLISTEISIIGRQYTAFDGTIPMNLMGLTLVSSNFAVDNKIIPISCLGDGFGYGCSFEPYYFEAINEKSGYIVHQ